MVSCAPELVRRSLKANVGEAACCTTSTPSTWKFRSGMGSFFHAGSAFDRDGPALQLSEELAQFLPNFRAPRQPFPMHANQTHELVALVDRKQVIFRGRMSPRVSQAVREQGFHVGLHFV